MGAYGESQAGHVRDEGVMCVEVIKRMGDWYVLPAELVA